MSRKYGNSPPIRTKRQGTLGAQRHIASGMMENSLFRARCGARQAMQRGNLLLLAACLVSILACPAAAIPPPEPGPTASASIRISVSVARRYGLAHDDGPMVQRLERHAGNQFCLALNGDEMPPSVLLIYSPTGDAAAGKKAVRLLPCGSSSHALETAEAFKAYTPVRELIVSPE